MISLALVVITLFHVNENTIHFEDVAKTLYLYNFYIAVIFLNVPIHLKENLLEMPTYKHNNSL